LLRTDALIVLLLFAYGKKIKAPVIVASYAIIMLSLAGGILGVYAACKDIADKWSQCHYTVSFS
jgi:uncharacterized YccA/Bax inhibitor family protein